MTNGTFHFRIFTYNYLPHGEEEKIFEFNPKAIPMFLFKKGGTIQIKFKFFIYVNFFFIVKVNFPIE